MRFPDEPMYISRPGPSITTRHLRFDPDQPHPYQQAPGVQSGCATCGAGWRHVLHLEPIGGWPKVTA